MAKDDGIPAEAPPSYQQATGSSTATTSSSRPNASSSNTLQVPGNGIPAGARRSMEDESRGLPKGWIRTFDPTSKHQFYVDTTKEPPRSIWVHPYDDDEYLSTLSSEERERIEEESFGRGHQPSKADIIASHSDDEDDHHPTSATSTKPSSELPPRPQDGKGKGKGKDDGRSFGRKFKDKVTGTTHEEREVQRRKRAEEERKMYEFHAKVRQAMAVAAQTGQAQMVGKDTDGKEIWVEPPAPYSAPYGGYRGGYGVNPYSGGVYTTPNARYIRPPNPYSRPMGGGFGGGYGMPLALGGGLLGGLLLGDALGGF